MTFDYLSLNHKTFRAVANEEFLTLEFRRAWIIFCSFCAGENGCPNNLKAIAKAAMIPLAEAEQFAGEIAELVEERDGLIAPLEVWRAVDLAAKWQETARENGKKGGRPKQTQREAIGFEKKPIGFENEANANQQPPKENLKVKVKERKGKEESESTSFEGDMRAGAREAAPLSLETELDEICQAIQAVTGVNPKTGWQISDKVRGLAVQVHANGDTGAILRELVRIRGKPYRLSFLLEDYQQDKLRQQQEASNGQNRPNSTSGAGAGGGTVVTWEASEGSL